MFGNGCLGCDVQEIFGNQESAGWSRFHYLREYGHNSSEWSESEGAEHLKVAHLGVFLDEDENGA